MNLKNLDLIIAKFNTGEIREKLSYHFNFRLYRTNAMTS
jgi:hypothetical protein